VRRSFSKFPLDLKDGYLKIDKILLRNTIPVPLDQVGEIELEMEGFGETS